MFGVECFFLNAADIFSRHVTDLFRNLQFCNFFPLLFFLLLSVTTVILFNKPWIRGEVLVLKLIFFTFKGHLFPFNPARQNKKVTTQTPIINIMVKMIEEKCACTSFVSLYRICIGNRYGACVMG